MKAYVLHNINCLKMEDIPLPAVPEGWVLMEVKAVGICGSDIPRIFKTGAHRHPLVPGHEFSGRVLTEEEIEYLYEYGQIAVSLEDIAEKEEITAAAENLQKRVETAATHKIMPATKEAKSQTLQLKSDNTQQKWAGKRVGVFPLIPCGTCDCCRQKRYEMCSNYNYLGSRCDGAFAQYAAVPEWNLLPLPDFVSYETAAMLEPMAVAAHALRAAAPAENETAAVCGLGTIGLLMVMLLKQAGVKRILAIGNKDFQKDCIKLISDSDTAEKNAYPARKTAEQDIHSGRENSVELVPQDFMEETGSEKCRIEFADQRTTDVEAWVLSQTGGQGAALFFECVGKNETLLQAIRCTQPGGRIELVGNPASDMLLDKDTYWRILRKQLTLRGTWNSSFLGEINKEMLDDWHYVLSILPGIQPEVLITHRLPLEELEKGLSIMRDKTEDFVKIMILPENGIDG